MYPPEMRQIAEGKEIGPTIPDPIKVCCSLLAAQGSTSRLFSELGPKGKYILLSICECISLSDRLNQAVTYIFI